MNISFKTDKLFASSMNVLYELPHYKFLFKVAENSFQYFPRLTV